MSDTLIIAVTIFVSIYMISLLVYLGFRQYMRLKDRELKQEHAKLDDFRAHLERQLMELNLKFSSSEKRWSELNHLVVSGQNELSLEDGFSSHVQPSLFLESHGIDPRFHPVDNKLLFVLTPFHDDLKDEFDVAVSVGSEFGFKVMRGDEKASQGDIFPQLLRMIVSAKVVIANISGRNPNVFYELGIAHAIGKPVILLAHSESDVPFDVRSKPIVFYRSNEELREKLSKMLVRTLISSDK